MYFVLYNHQSKNLLRRGVFVLRVCRQYLLLKYSVLEATGKWMWVCTLGCEIEFRIKAIQIKGWKIPGEHFNILYIAWPQYVQLQYNIVRTKPGLALCAYSRQYIFDRYILHKHKHSQWMFTYTVWTYLYARRIYVRVSTNHTELNMHL